MITYGLLGLAIAIEVAASLSLKASNGFRLVWPGLIALLGFGTSLVLLTYVSSKLPLSLTYPTWAGLGIVGATLGAMAFFGERISIQQWVGIGLVIVGIAIMYLPFANDTGHA